MSASDLLDLLKRTFPNASREALSVEVDYFTTPFSVEPERLPVADKQKQKEHLEKILSGLRQALRAYEELHPIVRREFDREFKHTAALAREIAPGPARPLVPPVSFDMSVAALIWAIAGHRPGKPHPQRKIDIPAALSPAREAVERLVQPSGRGGVYERVALVNHCERLWRKHTGEEPKLTGAKFRDFVEAFGHAIGFEVDAVNAIQAYQRQRRRLG